MAATACGECGRGIESEFNFCPECGAELAVETCSECGTVIEADASRCPECGAGGGRGPDVDTATEAVEALPDTDQQALLEMIRTDPALIPAFTQLLRMRPRPDDDTAELLEHQQAMKQVLSDADNGLSAKELAEGVHETYVVDREEPLTDRDPVPRRISEEWIAEQAEAMVADGQLGRFVLTDDTVRYTDTVSRVISREMTTDDITFEDVDTLIEETGMHRPSVLRQLLVYNYADLVLE